MRGITEKLGIKIIVDFFTTFVVLFTTNDVTSGKDWIDGAPFWVEVEK